MKIFECILDYRVGEIVERTVNQARFVKNYGTTDAIHAARLLMEKHRPLYIAFLGLQKAFERVPHELIWYALRQHLVPEELMRWVQLLTDSHETGTITVSGSDLPRTERFE